MQVNRLVTVEDQSERFPVIGIGNEWSRRFYDGPFYLFKAPDARPAISLVFVQSRDGNTGAANPADLGGGPTDRYLIYEGLSRVAADAVLAGASTVGGSVFFSIPHPELAALRAELGLPRYPVQMVISNSGNVDLSARLFSNPEARVLVLAGERCLRVLAEPLRDRPWITMVPIGDSLTRALELVRRDYGIGRISAVGGRITATSLVDAGLVQDLHLTTSAIDAGESDTPWYVGTRNVRLETIVRKREVTVRSPLLFEHLAVRVDAG